MDYSNTEITVSTNQLQIVITGSRRGIGRVLAEHFLARDHRVFGCSLHSTDLRHSNYSHSEIDISDAVQVQRFFDEVRQNTSGVNICLNCAGVAGMNHILLTPPDQATSIVKTNLLGAFFVTQEASRAMMKSGGLIVHFSTTAVRLNLEGECAYASSKAGVETLVRIAAKELESMKIRINALALGPVATDLTRNVPKEKIDRLLVASGRSKMISNDEITGEIEGFIADESRTGQIIDL